MKRNLLFVLFCIVLILSACGSENGSSSKGNDIVVAFGSEPITLDPQDANDAVSNQANVLLYDKLVTFDKENNVVPELATKWEAAEDATGITFTLREDVTFQDGTPFNAEAVKINFERILDEENKLSRHSLYADFIESVIVDSEYQVTFKFKEAFGPALSSFAHGAGGIISPKAIKDNADIGKQPVGSGPYKLKKWTPGTELVLEVNPEYWGGKKKLDTITFKPVPENSSRTIMLENGEVDVIAPIATQDIERLKENKNVTVNTTPIYRTIYITINQSNPIFENVKVRQALNYAVDKNTLVDKILLGQGKVAEAAIGSSVAGYSSVGTYEYNPEKAKELLAEAGIEEGTTIKLWTPDGRYLMDSKIAEFIQANLQEVGFNVEFQKWEWSAYSNMLDDPDSDYDLIVNSWGTSTGDADWGLRPLFTTDGSNNYSNYSNSEVDKLITEGLSNPNIEERTKIYNKAMNIIKDEAPWIFLAEYQTATGVRNDLQGVYTWGNEYVILRDAERK
ncbi:glutathione ABC transporter substrate-binding protein [Sporosarcina sp. ACRSL]|uniref:glutathione ABC transporter substrate-binding protein n=1 Tax=Sporosarcina sp. ACRSL TaxID=2918215 RepID=UPI001EF471C2|nr:glutathione ABC transporter substrate-binding protein [Sporosarcina sp. ACRSL]MCG7344059.1 glutathione ABC transporter substrate-binding protein [Sporosarcina sp. ACRSL]